MKLCGSPAYLCLIAILVCLERSICRNIKLCVFRYTHAYVYIKNLFSTLKLTFCWFEMSCLFQWDFVFFCSVSRGVFNVGQQSILSQLTSQTNNLNQLKQSNALTSGLLGYVIYVGQNALWSWNCALLHCFL